MRLDGVYMVNKERRKSIRVPLTTELCQWKLMDGIETHESNLMDFTRYGCFVKATLSPQPKSYIYIFFKLPGDLGIVKLDAQVAWVRWSKRKNKRDELGFGVRFIDVAENMDKILEAYQTYLRNKQIIIVSKRIIEEFFDRVPPTVKR